MAQQRGSQNRKLLVGLQTAEAFFGFQHCGSGPSQRHPCITPTFDVAADLPQHGHQALDRVGAAKRAPKFRRQTQTDHGEHFVQTFEDRSRDARGIVIEPARQVLENPFRLFGTADLAWQPLLTSLLAPGQALALVGGLAWSGRIAQKAAREAKTSSLPVIAYCLLATLVMLWLVL